MGSGDCFRTIIIRKKLKQDRSKQRKRESSSGETNGTRQADKEESAIPANGFSGNPARKAMPSEDIAARRIQASFKRYLARKSVHCLKGMTRYHGAIKSLAVENQQSSALQLIHFWAKLQAEINARRLCMVTEGRINQKKLENKLKLETKLHEVEVEWSSGSETIEDILQRIQHREAAAMKRERAMAYAFSHQWRANTSQCFGRAYYDLGKDSWGWSWKERWVAVRPWEIRVQSKPTSSKKIHGSQADKAGKTSNAADVKLNLTVKPPLHNGKYTAEPRKSINHTVQ